MAQEKKMIDQVGSWLRLFDDGSVDRTWTGPPEAKFMTEPVPPHHHFIDGVATADVTTADGLKLRIYLPEKQENDPAKLPTLLHFHGGGFCFSAADWFLYYAFYTCLAREARAIVVSVFLRLAPEHRLPAAIDDGFSALRWIRCGGAAAEPWLHERADLGRVFLIGESTGANIVHQVAALAGGEDESPVSLGGVILIQPGFSRSRRSKSEMEEAETPFLTLEMIDKMFRLALPEGATKDHPITCPMGEAAAPLETLKLPAYLYCLAEQDLMKDREMEFYEGMRRANKEVEMLRSEGVGHAFYLNKIAVDMDPATADQTRFLLRGIKDFDRSGFPRNDYQVWCEQKNTRNLRGSIYWNRSTSTGKREYAFIA